MKQKLKKILSTIFSYKGALILSAFAVLLIMPEQTFAATPSSSTAGDNSETVQNFAETLGIIVSFLNTLIWPLLLAIGDLMDVDMIIGPGMESRLLDIWIQVRNLVNIAFVLVLLAVAFYNVLGLGGGEGELAIKTALPKVIIGLVLVNFTYVGGRVMLDVANVGTTIAFGLPQVIQADQDGTTGGYSFTPEIEKFEKGICFKPEDTSTEETSSETSSETASTVSTLKTYTEEEAPIQTKIFCEYNALTTEIEETLEDGKTLTVPGDSYGGLRNSLKQQYFSDLNKNNVALIMAVNMGNLGSQNLLKGDEIKTFKDLTVNLIFSTVMYVIFAVSYVVLAIILLVRVVVLWLALAFSPIAVLTYVVPQIKEWLGGGGDFSQKVIKHLIAPIIIGFTLSMGFLLMSAWNQVGNATSTYSSTSSTEVDQVIGEGLLISGIDDLPKLILAIASIVVVWMGVFSAAEGTYAEGITSKIKDVGTQVKDFAFKLPMLAPMLPINVKGENRENTSLMALGSVLNSGLESFQDTQLQGQVKTLLDGNEGLRRWAGDRATDDTGKESNRLNVQGLISDNQARGAFSEEEAQKLARSLYYIVQGNDEIDEDKKKTYLEQLKEFEKNPRDFDELRDIIKSSGDGKDFLMTDAHYRLVTSKKSFRDEFDTQDEDEEEEDEDEDKGKGKGKTSETPKTSKPADEKPKDEGKKPETPPPSTTSTSGKVPTTEEPEEPEEKPE